MFFVWITGVLGWFLWKLHWIRPQLCTFPSAGTFLYSAKEKHGKWLKLSGVFITMKTSKRKHVFASFVFMIQRKVHLLCLHAVKKLLWSLFVTRWLTVQHEWNYIMRHVPPKRFFWFCVYNIFVFVCYADSSGVLSWSKKIKIKIECIITDWCNELFIKGLE